uniref:Uncharacterized protein n=1 Tax=Arundo donax TaxID=35708 RepID=A0A0A9CDG9_ARUDO
MLLLDYVLDCLIML